MVAECRVPEKQCVDDVELGPGQAVESQRYGRFPYVDLGAATKVAGIPGYEGCIFRLLGFQ